MQILGKFSPARMAVGGLGVAALGIAVAVWLINGSATQAGECAAQPERAALIDAAAQGELAALLATAQGRGYSEMAFQDDTGRPMTMADFAGQKLLVNFWATWCGPCREEMPALNTIAGDYDSDEFSVVAINLDLGQDGVELAQQFLDENDLPNLALYADPTFNAFELLKAQAVSLGLPTTLLLDEQGCELAVLQGPAVWDSQDGRNVVDALIGS